MEIKVKSLTKEKTKTKAKKNSLRDEILKTLTELKSDCKNFK